MLAVCEHPTVPVEIRLAGEGDRLPVARLFAAPWDLDRTLVAIEEGRRVRHIRRRNGELWDLIEMGLLLER